MKQITLRRSLAALVLSCPQLIYKVHAFAPISSSRTSSNQDSRLFEETTVTAESLNTVTSSSSPNPLSSAIGTTIDEQRIVFPELSSGEVTRMFSSLSYNKDPQDGSIVAATHASGSTLGASALVAGTTVGAGILALPAATAVCGFVPSTAAMTVAWLFMTTSGLLIAELSLNRFGETGRPGLGLLDLYESLLGKSFGVIGSAAYFFLHYAIMVAYIAQGGTNAIGFLNDVGLGQYLGDIPGIGQLLFAGTCGLALYTGKESLIEKVNNVFVLGVFGSFLGILGLGASSADYSALIDPINQHPAAVIGSLPILILSLVYQNVVPTVVTQLEADRSKITKAIVTGTTLPFLMFVLWNAVILGNVLGMDTTQELGQVDPVAILQSATGGSGQVLANLVGSFSELALITSLIGFVYGLLDALTDVTGIASEGPEFDKWKPALFAGVFLPPLALSAADPQIFYNALDYGGAFGVSTLFLLLPPLMVWKSRYGQDTPLVAKPMVPLGKIPLVGMFTAAGGLIVQQAVDKFVV